MKKARGTAYGFLALTAVFLAFLTSCAAKNSGRTLERRELFALEYGAYGKNVNFSAQGDILLDFDAREGIFHILDIPSRKVMRLSSYGDILSVLYDPDGSKPPEFIQETGEAGKDLPASPGRYAAATRMAAPTLVAVDSAQTIYLADAPAESSSGGTIVRRFGTQGKELDFIGQEGREGTPFKKIVSLQIMDDDSLAVVSAAVGGYAVHRFTREGSLLSAMKMDSSGPAFPESAGNRANIDGMIFNGKDDVFELGLKIDLYGESIEKKSGASAGFDVVESWLVTLDGASGRQISRFRVWAKASSQEDPILLGRRGGQYVLLQVGAEGAGYSLLVVDGKGKTRGKYRMELPDGMKLVSRLKLLQGARLTGIVAGNASALALWWALP